MTFDVACVLSLLCVLALSATVFGLSRHLSEQNDRTMRMAENAMRHALAISEAERVYMIDSRAEGGETAALRREIDRLRERMKDLPFPTRDGLDPSSPPPIDGLIDFKG